MKYENVKMLPSEHCSVRYALIKEGVNPLIVIGFNPSQADETCPDKTMSSVLRIASNNGYDGFVMLNLYPFRSTSPDALPSVADEELHVKNIAVVLDILQKYSLSDVWVAYGNLALKRKYTRDYAEEILALLREQGRNMVCIGISKLGMPKHPLYAPAAAVLKKY